MTHTCEAAEKTWRKAEGTDQRVPSVVQPTEGLSTLSLGSRSRENNVVLIFHASSEYNLCIMAERVWTMLCWQGPERQPDMKSWLTPQTLSTSVCVYAARKAKARSINYLSWQITIEHLVMFAVPQCLVWTWVPRMQCYCHAGMEAAVVPPSDFKQITQQDGRLYIITSSLTVASVYTHPLSRKLNNWMSPSLFLSDQLTLNCSSSHWDILYVYLFLTKTDCFIPAMSPDVINVFIEFSE